MARIFASIGYNLGALTRFSGRDTKRQFWPYAIALFLLISLLGFVAVLPAIWHSFKTAIEHPELLREAAPGQGPMELSDLPPELIPDFQQALIIMAIVNALAVLLLAAAVTRRLHDRDRTGLWGLLPLPFHAAGVILGPQAATAAFAAPATADLRFFGLTMLNSFLLYGTLIYLIVLLVGDGTDGPNRFGPAPPEQQA